MLIKVYIASDAAPQLSNSTSIRTLRSFLPSLLYQQLYLLQLFNILLLLRLVTMKTTFIAFACTLVALTAAAAVPGSVDGSIVQVQTHSQRSMRLVLANLN